MGQMRGIIFEWQYVFCIIWAPHIIRSRYYVILLRCETSCVSFFFLPKFAQAPTPTPNEKRGHTLHIINWKKRQNKQNMGSCESTCGDDILLYAFQLGRLQNYTTLTVRGRIAATKESEVCQTAYGLKRQDTPRIGELEPLPVELGAQEQNRKNVLKLETITEHVRPREKFLRRFHRIGSIHSPFANKIAQWS